MNMRRAPGVRVIAQRIRTGLDCYESVIARSIAERSPTTREIRIQGAGVLVILVHIPPACVRLPDFDQRVWHGASIVVEHSPGNADALPNGFARMLARQIIVVLSDVVVAEDRAGDF